MGLDGNNSKKDYEPIPDVETGKVTTGPAVNQEQATERAKKEYAFLELDDDQARLIGTLDEAMKHSALNLNLPTLSRRELQTISESGWVPQAKAFMLGLVQPTLTALVTFGIALYLDGQQRFQQAQEEGQQRTQEMQTNAMSSPWIIYTIVLFPYVNATLVFCATVLPIQKRFITSIEPIFKAMSHAEDTLQATVKKLGPFVDDTIDGIQNDFHTVLEPIKPALDQIENKAHLLEHVFENRGTGKQDLDIPDPSDIDRELDEAQGIVTGKIDEAQQHLQVEEYMPNYLKSQRQFYWRIVFPIIVLAWIVQMAAAYGSEYITDHHNNQHEVAMSSTAPNNNYRLLAESGPGGFDTAISFDPARDLDEFREADYGSSGTQMKEKARDFRDNATQQIHEQYDRYSGVVNETLHSLRGNLTNEYHQFKGEFNAAVAQSRSLVRDVIWSYLVSLLQILLIYIITSQVVQSWLVRQGMRQIQKGAERTLKEYGVSQALEEVFDERLGRAREKIFQLLQVYKKVQITLENAGAMSNFLPSGSPEQVAETLSGNAVQEAMKKSRPGNLFGTMFKKNR